MIAAFTVLMFEITLTISECIDKSNEIINLEQQCGLQSSHTVYFGSSFDETTNTWFDLSGNCRNIEKGYISNSIMTHPHELNGETYISGTTLTQIIFPEDVLPLEWTLFHIAKYNGPVRDRIFTGFYEKNNWLSGFNGASSGIAFHSGWITTQEDIHGTDWVFSTDQRNMYRSNGVDRTTASQDPAQGMNSVQTVWKKKYLKNTC